MLGLFWSWLFALSAEEVCCCNIEHDVSYPGVVGNIVPQSNISVNKFHLREGTNASLERSEKGTSNSTPLKTRDNCLKFVKLIAMPETAEEQERKQSMNHAAKYQHFRS